MAKITEEDVLKLAKLSRLQFSASEVTAMTKEIETILKYVEQLQGLDLKKYDPTYQVTGLKNVYRTDEPYNFNISPEELLKNVPSTLDGYIKVRRVLE